jgi:hypothetical protein
MPTVRPKTQHGSEVELSPVGTHSKAHFFARLNGLNKLKTISKQSVIWSRATMKRSRRKIDRLQVFFD